MGIAAITDKVTSPIERSSSSTTRYVEPTRTPVARADLRAAIGRAYHKLTGKAPSGSLLDTLTAHASLETGSGSQMYNYNFGGIKGRSPTGETARCRTKEVENGREIEIRDGFRAYRTLDDGALDYVRLMRDRFGGAVSRAEAGDLDGFAHALKKAAYYTADETKYAAALHGLDDPAAKANAGVASSKAISRLGGLGHFNLSVGDGDTPPTTFADSVELSRVIDAIARHPNVVDEDDDD